MFNTAKQIAEIESQIRELEIELNLARSRAQALFQHGKCQSQSLDSYYTSLLTKNQKITLDLLASRPPPSIAAWSNSRWNSWVAAMEGEVKLIRIGEMIEQESPQISVPAYAPFIGVHKTIIIRSTDVTQGLSLLQSLVVRTACLLPHQARYTLLDPSGGGIAFPMRRHLPQVRESSGDVCHDLDQVIGDIQRFIERYLDASTLSFELLPPGIRMNEDFQFVFAANFPHHYDRRAIETLQMVGNTGPIAGIYLFIHQNLSHELPHGVHMDDFKNAFYIDLTNPIISSQGWCFQPDTAPSPQVQNRIFEALRMAKPQERLLDWGSIVGIPESDWWKETTRERVETPIGLQGGGQSLNIWFGTKNERPCVHGLLGAMTGSGRSNLYHVLIAGLAIRYSPKELRLYLIDGKNGIDFQSYCYLPHAEVVSLRSPAEFSRTILAELIAEKERRKALFSHLGVADFTAYYEKKLSREHLPRILLLVDEYQELFEGDRDGSASSYLLQLAQQGHSVGIHMLLGSHCFAAPGMLFQSAVFGNMHLRMAMHMTDTDIQALSEFGKRGKALISTCDLPGEIVLNDKSGDDTSNQFGKVAYLSRERRDRLQQKLITKASAFPKAYVPRTVIFDGQAQPNLLENPQFAILLQQQTWPTEEYMATQARKSRTEGGLDISDWFAAEHPRIIWLGQEFSIRGQARAILRRRTSENMLVIGSASAPRYGMLASTLASLSVCGKPTDTRFIIVDRGIAGTQWSETLCSVCDAVLRPAGFSIDYTRESTVVDSILDDLLQELTRRQQLGEEKQIDLPSIFVMMTELDRVARLRRKADAYGLAESASGKKLRRLLIEGPPTGIHMILSFTGVRPMTYVIDDRNSLIHFRHRVALHMSEDESFTFVRSRKAAQLQIEGPRPTCALYLDTENDYAVRFKPYSIDKNTATQQDSVAEQIQQIGKTLAQRKQAQ
jgi:S-DNA-T family DNA segregation ATPase FtsK/SpoIIIE